MKQLPLGLLELEIMTTQVCQESEQVCEAIAAREKMSMRKNTQVCQESEQVCEQVVMLGM